MKSTKPTPWKPAGICRMAGGAGGKPPKNLKSERGNQNQKKLDRSQSINSHLPPSVRVLAAQRVNKGFNARERCRHRTYHYFLPASAIGLTLDGENLTESQRVLSMPSLTAGRRRCFQSTWASMPAYYMPAPFPLDINGVQGGLILHIWPLTRPQTEPKDVLGLRAMEDEAGSRKAGRGCCTARRRCVPGFKA